MTMVDKSYMVGKAWPPSALISFFNRQVIPEAIEAAASIEQGLERIAVATRRRPLTSVLAAMAVGFVSAVAIVGRRGRV
jgi:hypothetical protein